ncbi:MAG: cytochrome-c oxidase, cbb3-type subunit III [Gammaproteobacteria bacterium]|jgi:cytochrome c oxidase cbb3-type subunit 3|nr:cytochrome-c oxidase, cbb3-type subunit III [Gammaproteobacteria bacterium]
MAGPNPFPGENNTGHFWDDNLRELNNPPPSWWMIGFWASIAFVIGYLILYPMWPMPYQPVEGDGFTKGVMGWTQIKEYQEGLQDLQEMRAQYESQVAEKTAEQILADPALTQYTLASAKVLFGDYCAACHGSGGQGNPGYPVLADDDWLYGGSLAKLDETITYGRKGAMTAHKDILSAAEVDALAQFVVNLSQGNATDEGWALYNAKGCNACHGPTANGVLAELPGGEIVSVGAANLTDAIWRFEPGGLESAKHTILYGVNQAGVEGTRDAVMPGFVETGKLDPVEVKKLVVYVHELGGGK